MKDLPCDLAEDEERAPGDLPDTEEAGPPPSRQGRHRARTARRDEVARQVASESDVSVQDRLRLVVLRPRTRAECEDGERPCPFVGCKYHLYLDVNEETGAIKINFPHLAGPEAMPDGTSCALDVAARRGTTLDEVGKIMNLTRERVRQIEAAAMLRAERGFEDQDVGPEDLPTRFAGWFALIE